MAASPSMLNSRGKPTSSALVVTIHAAFPAFATVQLSQPLVELAASEMAARVEGETMSFSAAMRSANVSCDGSYVSSWRSESEMTESRSEPASDEADDQASSETSVTRTLQRRSSASSGQQSVSCECAMAVRESWRWRAGRAGRASRVVRMGQRAFCRVCERARAHIVAIGEDGWMRLARDER